MLSDLTWVQLLLSHPMKWKLLQMIHMSNLWKKLAFHDDTYVRLYTPVSLLGHIIPTHIHKCPSAQVNYYVSTSIIAKHPDATSMGKMLLLDSVSGSEMENFTTPTHEKTTYVMSLIYVMKFLSRDTIKRLLGNIKPDPSNIRNYTEQTGRT